MREFAPAARRSKARAGIQAKAANRGNQGNGVAVGLDNAGVGVDLKERVQVEEVCRILEEPPLLGFAMADQLNVSQMAAVDRRHVATRPPTRVARHVRIGFVGTVREILREEIPALVWKVCLYLVDCFHFRAAIKDHSHAFC